MKKFLLIISLLFLSGCTIDYNVLIKNNGEIEEKSLLNFQNNIVDSSVSIKEMFENRMTYYKSVPDYLNCFFDYSINTNDSLFKTFCKFKNVVEFKKSKILSDVFKNISVSKEQNITKMIISGYDYYSIYTNNSESPEYDPAKDKTAVKKMTIAIELEKEVVNSNADRFDNESNTYYWELDPYTTKKEISISYNQNTRYDIVIKNIIKNNLFTFIGYTIIIVCVSIIAVKFGFKSKNNSTI